MKPLKGYADVTDAHVKKPCEKEVCLRTAEIHTKYNELEHKFTHWYCYRHAYNEFSKRKPQP